MLKALICDDEPTVRSGLRKVIDWEANGWQICADAGDGQSAIDLIKEHGPDLVLLDIKMPGLSGIDVLRAFAQEKTKPCFLVLTGHSDFTYAKDALNLGARGYLLKPVDEDELLEKIAEARKEAEKTRADERKKALKEILLSEKEPDFPLEGEEYRCVLISPDLCGFSNDPSSLEVNANEFFSLLPHDSFILDDALALVFKNTPNATIERHLGQFHERVSRKARVGSIASLGNSGTGKPGLRESYSQARELFKNLFFEPDAAYLVRDDANQAIPAPHADDRAMPSIERLISYVELYELHLIDRFFGEMEQGLKARGGTPELVKKECLSFLVAFRTLLAAKHPDKNILTDPNTDYEGMIMRARYYTEATGAMMECARSLAESFSASSPAHAVLKVIQYVKTNFARELRLETLGELFNINSAYLGKRFKEHTGESFNSFVDYVRVNEAKRLLQDTEYKAYQIASMVGYSNADYFFAKFKHWTGMTPGSYRDTTRKDN